METGSTTPVTSLPPWSAIPSAAEGIVDQGVKERLPGINVVGVVLAKTLKARYRSGLWHREGERGAVLEIQMGHGKGAAGARERY